MAKRPGYRREKPLYLLKFADEEFDGLEVMSKSVPLGEFFELQRLQAVAASDPDAAEKIVTQMANVLVSWNLEDEHGKPVPCNYAGVSSQDMPFVLVIFAAWMEAVAGVPNLSPPASSDGGTSLEPSIPMEPVSSSQPS